MASSIKTTVAQAAPTISTLGGGRSAVAETLDSVVDHSAVVLPVPPAQSRTVALLLGAMVIGCLIAGSLLRHSTATFTQVAETPAWAAPPQLAGR